MSEIDDRLREVEESVRTIANYVKTSIEAMGKNAPAHVAGGLERRLERIEKNAEHALKAAEEAATIGTQVEALRKQLKAPQSNVEAALQREISRIDDRIRPLEKTSASAAQAHSSVESVKKRMDDLDAKMKSVAAESSAAQERHEKFSKQLTDGMNRLEDLVHTSVRAAGKDMEQRIEGRFNSMETLIHDSSQVMKEDFERRITSELANIEEIMKDSGRMLTEAGMEKYLETINTLKNNLERYVSVKAQLLETDIRDIKDSVARMSQQDSGKMEKRAESIESDIAAIKEMSSQIPEIKSGLSNMRSHVYDLEDKIASSAVDKEVQALGKSVVEMRTAFAELERGSGAKISETQSRLEENMNKARSEFEEKVKSAAQRIDDAERKFVEAHDAMELQKTNKKVQELSDMVEENFVGDSSVHRKINDIENRLSYVNALREELAAARRESDEKYSKIGTMVEENFISDSSVHKKLSDMEARLNEFGKSKKELEATKRAMGEDMRENKATIAALGNRLKEVEGHMHGLGKNVDFQKLSKELHENRKTMEEFEKDMKTQAMGLIGKQLSEFAAVMDRRLPDLVTKENYLHDMATLNHKISTVEAPDMSDVNSRVLLLEDKINEVSRMVRNMYNRMPVVVE